MKLTKLQREVVRVLNAGGILWQYSTHGYAWLIHNDVSRAIRARSIARMEELGIIEIDEAQTVYRADSGSDIHYALPTKFWNYGAK